jgi:TatD DNase family protein
MIDSHCHIAGEEFAADLEAVVARAHAAGVDRAMCILSDDDEAERSRAVDVRRLWPSIKFATGIHPHNAARCEGRLDAALGELRAALAFHHASALGEIGLDYHYDFAPRGIQQDVFRAQIRLACELGLPIVIHTREATGDTFDILKEEGRGGLRGVFHCFTGDPAMARAAIDDGFHVSFAGILTIPSAGEIREAAALVPDDRLLTETDSPYLAPVPHRGKRNEPAWVARVVETLATVRQTTVEAIAARTRANFEALFGA